MATMLTKRVERESNTKIRHRPLIVALLPGGLLELREKGTRKKWHLPFDAAFSLAVKIEVNAEKARKKEAAKAKRKK